MARSKKTRESNGNGSYRKKTITKNGKKYKFWEGRITLGYDENGKQIMRSVSGKTKGEVQGKIDEIKQQNRNQTLVPKSGMTVEKWMTTWGNDFLNHVAAGTAHEYRQKVKSYIIPALGAVKLQKLTPIQVQTFVNSLSRSKPEGGKGLSPKYVKDIHGVLHRALDVAMSNKLIGSNPADDCSLPRISSIPRGQYDIDNIKDFLAAINGQIHERYYKLLLMTGMREAEPLGLTWDCIDFRNHVIHVRKQLQRNRDTGEYELVVPKREEIRDLPMGDELYDLLKEQKACEQEKRRICGDCWQNKNLVFSNSTGGYLSYRTVYDCYKRIVKKIGLPEMRVHDLRHAYAMLSLSNGDDVKTVQTNLGHKSPDFTMKVYAYSPDSVKQESGARMSDCIRELSNKNGENGKL